MQPRNNGLLTFAAYGRRIGVDRSTVGRWAAKGIISTKQGMIEPSIADQELAAHRPLPRGRAAWRAWESRSAPAAVTVRQPQAADGWPPATAVLSVLRAHGPAFLAARLSTEGMSSETIAVVCLHLEEMISAVAGAAWPCVPSDGDPLADGTIAPPQWPEIPGVDLQRMRAAFLAPERDDRLFELMDAEQEVAGRTFGNR